MRKTVFWDSPSIKTVFRSNSGPFSSPTPSLSKLGQGTGELIWDGRHDESVSDSDTERTEVRVKLPRYQKEEWAGDAEDLDMSQAEFVRTMVQAGRSELGLDADAASRAAASAEPPSRTVDPGGDGLEERVLGVLRQEEVMSWDDLLDAVVGDLEDRLDETMGELQQSGRVRFSGRDGGYVLTDE